MRLPASLSAVLMADVSIRKDNEKKKQIDRNARGSTKVLDINSFVCFKLRETYQAIVSE